ncbi:MAG: hypothetical protein KF838_15105 [Phycisphaeraceae bacterium]|nr:MAG: hypothetical protein KF838_15105 [Phycisphaeraceae bacterium]
MSPAIGTSSDFVDFAPHAGRIEHRHAACERASACHDPCVTERDADCFERGPVPFADFLYHENRRLAFEHPRLAVGSDAVSGGDGRIAPESGIAPALTSPESARPVDAARSESNAGEQRTTRQGAIVLNLSRPTLVAKFIDLYA